MDSSQENFKMSSFPELDNLIDAAFQVQQEPLMDQPTSIDEEMDPRIIIGIITVGVIAAIALVHSDSTVTAQVSRINLWSGIDLLSIF